MKKGALVLATKYRDGDPGDAFCVGYFSGMNGDRFLVEDENGKPFRVGGFRRCEGIARKTAEILVAAIPEISDKTGKSLWYWRRHLNECAALAALGRTGAKHE